MSEMAISQYFRNDVIKSRFAEIVGDHNAGAYIASVLLAVANDQSGLLRQATPESIYVSALRAASLRLSVDPSTGQAYLVPFRNKGEQTATLIVGYKGLYDMAVRTGKYRYINVGKVYDGEDVQEDRITGFHEIVGNKITKTVVGWIGAFEMNNRYAKTIYMTIEEIHEHARKYSKSYDNPKGIWKVNPQAMEKKTVLRILLRRWGYLDPSDAAIVDQVDEDNTGIEVEAIDIEEGEVTQETEAETLAGLGFEVDEPKETKTVQRPPTTQPATLPAMSLETAKKVKSSQGKDYGDIDSEKLGYMEKAIIDKLEKNHLTTEQRDDHNLKLDAIKVILASRQEA